MAKTIITSVACDFMCMVQDEGGVSREYKLNFEFGPNVTDVAKQSLQQLNTIVEKISE